MKKINLLLFIILFLLFDSYAQNEGKELHLLKIKDKQISILMQQLIDKEKNCLYYTDSLSFHIYIDKIPTDFNNFSISIESYVGSSIVRRHYPYIGYFYIEKHLFLVHETHISNLFIKTPQKKWFNFWKHNPNEILALDDSYSVFQYWYIDNKLHLEEIYGCEKKSDKGNSDNSQKTIKESK